MDVSIRALVDLSMLLSLYAFIPGVSGLVMVGVDQAITKGKFSLREGGFVTKAGMACTLVAILGLVIAFTGFIFAGLWWLWNVFSEDMSPGRLAVYSLMIGPAPLVFPLLAKIICKLTGGSVDSSQVNACDFLGLNFNRFVHTLFMSYMLVIFTGGIAIFGLLGSGMWALARLF